MLQRPPPFQQVLTDVRSHLGNTTSTYTRFLTLLEQLVATSDPHQVDEIIVALARLLRTSPTTLYQLNPLFYPRARVEFNVKHARVTSFVLRTSNIARIVILDSHHGDPSTFHNLTTHQIRDIILRHAAGAQTCDSLLGVKDPALRDCLAQLTQDLLDEPDLSKAHRREILKFLRCLGGTPPSLLLYDLKELDPFTHTIISDLHHGLLADSKVVIKKLRIPKETLDNSEGGSLILREVIICRQFHHPNVLPFLGVCFDEQDRLRALVTPYVKHGNIIEFLESHPTIDRLTPVWQIMRGLEFLHTFEPPVAHRNVKGTNILVNERLVCCLSDFGISAIPELAQRSRDYAVTAMPWTAPEILAPPETGQVDLYKADVFALGITILEIYSGQAPLSDRGFSAIYMARVIRKEVPSFPTNCPFPVPPFLSELVEMMLDYDPIGRPSIRLICQGFEDNILFQREIPATEGIRNEPNEPDVSLVLETVQEWIRRERERMRKPNTRAKTTSAKNGSPSRMRVPRTIAGSSQARNVTTQPLHQPFNMDDFAGQPTLLTNLPFYRAVMSPAPLGQFRAPYIATLSQGSTPNPLTPPDSPPSASITLHPRPIPLAQYTPPILQYGRDSSYFTTSLHDQEPANSVTPFRPGVYGHSERSLSPPPSPDIPKRNNCSSGSASLGGRENTISSPVLQSYEGNPALPKRRRLHNHSRSSSPPGGRTSDLCASMH